MSMNLQCRHRVKEAWKISNRMLKSYASTMLTCSDDTQDCKKAPSAPKLDLPTEKDPCCFAMVLHNEIGTHLETLSIHMPKK